MMKKYISWCSVYLACIANWAVLCPPVLAEPESIAPSPVPGVEWTKIQDLKPEARADNRPIKQKWAVVIGAAKFKEHRLNSDQQSMDSSAKQFHEYLIDPHGGRFAPDHVKVLLNSEATRQNVVSVLGSSWLGRLAGPDDLVVVFIATNSFPTTDGSTYLCAYDCAIDNIYSTCFSMQTLMDTLRQNVKSDRIVLVLQACYSGAAQLTSGAKALYSGYNIDLDKVMLGKGYVLLSSSKPNQMTWGDVFSRRLVAALRQQDGLISLQKAFAIAQKETEEETTSSGRKTQTPVLKSDWTGNDLVLGTPPLEKVSALPEGVMNFLAAESYYLKATNSVAAGKLDEAIKDYEQAIAIDPQYADALADYGAVKSIKGDLPGAVELYERAIAVRPEDGLFHSNLARILDQQGKGKLVEEELELAYRYTPKDQIVLTALASKELAGNNPQRAVRLLGEAVALYPSSCSLRSRLSYAYIKLGDVDQAITQAKEAVKLDAKSASAQLNLGSSLLIKGDKTAAIAAYRQALGLEPNNADAHYLMSRALEASGEKVDASTELDQFLKLCNNSDPRVPIARKHLAELRQ